MKTGNCYVTSEALYHLLGGKKAGWTPMYVHMPAGLGRNMSHWFLRHESGLILDATAAQFKGTGWKPDYTQGIGCGFLTKKPSYRAKMLMAVMTWASEWSDFPWPNWSS